MSRPMAMTGFRRAVCFALCALCAAVALSACGKKNAPRPPEGEESSYTYPQTYPDPASVLADDTAEQPKSRQAPAHAGGISTFPSSSRTKTTYGSGAVQ